MDPLNVVRQLLEDITSKECWAAVCGPGTGSNVILHFGKKLVRDKPVRNSKLDQTMRKYQGEYSIFLQNAEWEVFCRGVSICDSNDDNGTDGRMVTGIRKILNKTIVGYRFNSNSGNFSIDFRDSLSLTLYCDELKGCGTCYSVARAGKTIALVECVE